VKEGSIHFSVGNEKKEIDDLRWRQRPDPGGGRPELWPPRIKAEQSSEELVDETIECRLRYERLKRENPQDIDELRKLQQDRSILMAKLNTMEWGIVERRVKEAFELSSVS
jgi:hypothetical protein